MKLPLAILLFTATSVLAQEPKTIVPTLSLDQEIFISDNIGVLNPSSIIRLKPLDTIKFILSDGTEITGIVKHTEEFNKEMFKVFGDVLNKPNTGFGFALVKQGSLSNEPVFAGAVVYRDTEETYTVQYSEEAKGFMLIKSNGKKTQIKIVKNFSKYKLTLPISVL
jgi:hypothetical protein